MVCVEFGVILWKIRDSLRNAHNLIFITVDHIPERNTTYHLLI
jgi:hypothetical protein